MMRKEQKEYIKGRVARLSRILDPLIAEGYKVYLATDGLRGDGEEIIRIELQSIEPHADKIARELAGKYLRRRKQCGPQRNSPWPHAEHPPNPNPASGICEGEDN